MAITVLNQANVPIGPFTRAQVADKIKSGEITADSLAFVEGVGLTQWTPLRDVLAKVDAASAPVLPLAPVPVTVPLAQPPAYSYAATMQPPSHLVYAGFWLRLVAYFIDGLIVSVVAFVGAFFVSLIFILIGSVFGASFNHATAYSGTNGNAQFFGGNASAHNPAAIMLIVLIEVAIYAIGIVVAWLYFARLESGPAQATYGKRALGLRVTDLAGQRIGFGRASGRFFGKIVSTMTFYIGFIMAGFTDRKQALHDMMAGTLVVRDR